jgi:hypothetical protein
VGNGLRVLADDDPLEVKEILSNPRRKHGLWVAFDKGLKSGQLGFVRLYFELLGYVGGQRDLVAAFLAGYGVQSMDQLKEIVAQHQGLEGYSLEDGERDALATLKLVLEQHPERAAAIRAELFGRDRVELAEEAPGSNGGALPGV